MKTLHQKKQIPGFNSDLEAEAFVADADLTNYDLSDFKPIQFELNRRLEAYKADKNPGRPAEIVIAEIKQSLQSC